MSQTRIVHTTRTHLPKGGFPEMELTNTDSLREELIMKDPELEEITLKKKKLAVKDQMHEIMLRHQKSEDSAH
jgi:hypothetical protein